ncbi:MAG: RluA family pseudouridine synthase [Anaeroplasmataceae bacterium]
MELKILYEDNHIIVVHKPKGILSQKDITNDPDMLTIIKDYIKRKYNKPGDVYLGLVHRLDRNTSGVMVFAKTSKAAARLNEMIKNNKLHKEYLAIVEGKMDLNDDFILLKNNIIKDDKQNKALISNNPESKEALLGYKVLDSINNLSLVRIKLITGRFHQIRCQFSNMGHPLYGDLKYGSKNNLGNYYSLEAYKLSFIHPTLKEKMEFSYISDERYFKIFKGKYDL